MIFNIQCKILSIDDTKPLIRRTLCRVTDLTYPTERKVAGTLAEADKVDLLVLDLPNPKPNYAPVEVGSVLKLELNVSAYSNDPITSRNLKRPVGVPTGAFGVTRDQSVNVDAYDVCFSGSCIEPSDKVVPTVLANVKRNKTAVWSPMLDAMTSDSNVFIFLGEGYQLIFPHQSKYLSNMPFGKIIYIALDVE